MISQLHPFLYFLVYLFVTVRILDHFHYKHVIFFNGTLLNCECVFFLNLRTYPVNGSKAASWLSNNKSLISLRGVIYMDHTTIRLYQRPNLQSTCMIINKLIKITLKFSSILWSELASNTFDHFSHLTCILCVTFLIIFHHFAILIPIISKKEKTVSYMHVEDSRPWKGEVP